MQSKVRINGLGTSAALNWTGFVGSLAAGMISPASASLASLLILSSAFAVFNSLASFCARNWISEKSTSSLTSVLKDAMLAIAVMLEVLLGENRPEKVMISGS